MWRKFEIVEGGHLWKQWVSVFEVTVYRCQECVAPANSSQYFKPTTMKLSPPTHAPPLPSCLIFQMPQSHTDETTAEPRATWQRLAAALPGSPTQIDYRSRLKICHRVFFSNVTDETSALLFVHKQWLSLASKFFLFFLHRFHWTAQLSASLLAEMAENPCQNLFWQQRLKYTFFLNGT